jgi:energy-coupling factor transport system ATP-binding protein
MALVVELKSFHYPGGRNLFEPAQLKLCAGDTVALVGGSGSGKSSLLTLLAGLHPQPLGGRWQGRITGGQDDFDFLEPSRLLGYLGPDPHAFLSGFCATVLEEVGWSLFGWGWTPEQVQQRVVETLQELGLSELIWLDPQELSGGQQQLVALAAVWARRPGYLLLDEPVSRLDPKARLRLQATVARLARSRGVGVLWSTANLGEVTWCDTVWSVQDSKIVVVGATEWDPGDGRCVLPWPVQWSVRWGTEPPSWTANTLRESGPFPDIPPAPLSGPLAIEVRGLVYRPPGRENGLFAGLDWQVRQGECLGLIGVNGAGKTTLARLIRGLLRPAEGTVKVAGHELQEQSVSTWASTVAYTFQEPANLFMRTRVDAELLYSGQLLGLDQKVAAHRAHQALQDFGLSDYTSTHPRELPATAAALLGVALSWYSQAPVQILDEPLARLDRAGRGILEWVIEGWRARGTTVVLIAHDLDWLCTICSSLAALEAGRVVAQGCATEVFAHLSVKKSLGQPLPSTLS